MAVQTAIGSGSYKNNSTTIFGAGNFSTGNITNDLSLLENAAVSPPNSQRVVLATGTAGSSGNVGTAKALSAGTFAYNPDANKWIMKRVSTTISGTSNNFLQSGGIKWDNRMNPAPLETNRRIPTYTVTANGWSKVTTYAGNVITYPNGVGGTASDNAARPTRSIPGEFTYRTGSPLPTNDDYDAITGK